MGLACVWVLVSEPHACGVLACRFVPGCLWCQCMQLQALQRVTRVTPFFGVGSAMNLAAQAIHVQCTLVALCCRAAALCCDVCDHMIMVHGIVAPGVFHSVCGMYGR
jgi:hypothetical protein